MYNIDDLFEKRSIVGSKLEELLHRQEITKAKFCAETGISRPTLDKLLTGNITNKVNFGNHMEKVLRYLSMTSDMFMGNIRNPYIKAKSLRSALHIKVSEISRLTGISSERILEIESGVEASMAELRDIALCFGVGVKSLLGESFFIPQIAVLADIIQLPEGVDGDYISGFWGHIGILPVHSKEYLWYPITTNTRSLIYHMQNKQHMIVPCMNNKLLYLNMQNVNSIILLDEACDQPGFTNWDSNIICGEIPQVVYESLDDYFYYMDLGNEPEPEEFSPKFIAAMKQITENMEWDQDVVYDITHSMTIHYTHNDVVTTSVDFNYSDSLVNEIETAYNFEDYNSSERMFFYHDLDGIEIMVNKDNISVIELPLSKTEDAISTAFFDEIKES